MIRVCRDFYWAALRPLYRHIVWCNPMHFIASLPCFQRNPAEIIPLSLSISCSVLPLPSQSFTIIHEGERKDTILQADRNFQTALHTIQPQLSASHFVTAEVFSRIVSIAMTFVHLEKLSLTNHIISDDFYDVLGCFPHLHSLTISSCHFETEGSVSPGSFITPDCLQDLTLRNITYKHKPNFAVLAAAPSLSSLCFDLTSGDYLPISGDIYKKLTELQVHNAPGWTLPRMSPQDAVAAALAIMSHSPLVEDFVFDISLPFTSAPGALVHLPYSLKTYRGPPDLLLKTVSHTNLPLILAVEISGGHINLHSTFSSMSHSLPGLQRLGVVLGSWDRSLPDALSHLKNLRNLAHIYINVGKLITVRNLLAYLCTTLMEVLGGPGEFFGSPFVGPHPTRRVEILSFAPKIKISVANSPNMTKFYDTIGYECSRIVLATPR